jgi:hypothetical protein
VRRRHADGERWIPVVDALNLRLVAEGSDPWCRDRIDELLAAAGQPPAAEPIGGVSAARELKAMHEFAASRRRQLEDSRRAPEPLSPDDPIEPKRPPWGTKAARLFEIERIRREIEQRRLREAADLRDAGPVGDNASDRPVEH